MWQEVTKEDFVLAERSAGFRPRGGGDGMATAGFTSGALQGKIAFGERSLPEKFLPLEEVDETN